MFKISNLTIHLNNEISLEEAISKKYRVNKKDVRVCAQPVLSHY